MFESTSHTCIESNVRRLYENRALQNQAHDFPNFQRKFPIENAKHVSTWQYHFASSSFNRCSEHLKVDFTYSTQVNRKLCVISGHFSTFSRSDALTARVKNHPQLYWESEISINTKKGFSKMIFVVMLKYFRHRHYKKLAGSMGSCCSTNHYIPNVSLAWYWNLKYC